MSRFNTARHQTKPAVALTTSPLATVSQAADTRTYEGGAGWTYTPQAELFRLATGAFLDGKGSFYESGAQQDARLRQLVTKVALDDPLWCLDFATWLRGPGNIRTAALMFAADVVKARLDAGLSLERHADDRSNVARTVSNRRIIDAVCRRPDEPGELLAYWTANYGRNIPKPVKRGIADAVRRAYNSKALLKYDTDSHAYRFGDTLNLTHPVPRELVGVQRRETDFSTGVECPHPEKKRLPSSWMHPALKERLPDLSTYYCECGWYHYTSTPQSTSPRRPENRVKTRQYVAKAGWQGDLFQYALDRRHNPDTATPPATDPVITARHELMELPVADRRAVVVGPGGADCLAKAGMTWEALAGWLQGPMDKAVWEAVIPSMGIMALIRNLRNFDQAGVSDEVAQQVIDKLCDPEQIAKSRQFPFRFHTAYREAPSLRWAYALDKALTASLSNVPRLGGRTLIMVDTSSSMESVMSGESTVLRWDVATLFGVALGHRCAQAEVVSFSSTAKYWGDPRGADTKVFPLLNGESLLRSIERWKTGGFFLGGGTDTALAVRRHFSGHDRVVIVTDEQVSDSGDPGAVVPRDVPMYTWNIAGYAAGHGPSGSAARFTFSGLTDKAFTLIPLLEAGAQGVWPWQVPATA